MMAHAIRKWTGLTATAVAAFFALPASASDFDLNALIEAAKTEPPISVYASTGKIKTSAEAFTAKYGIEANGSKVKGAAQIELVLREYQAGNVIGDLLISSDPAVAATELIPSGVVYSWLPPDLADDIGPDSRDPVVVWRDPAIWSYNNE
jgi:iron(III) transport system substrate-binding protein